MARKKSNSRPARWADAAGKAQSALEDLQSALEDLKSIQEEYAEWRDGMPENMQGTATYEKLEVVCDLDLDIDFGAVEEAIDVELPLGFGRD